MHPCNRLISDAKSKFYYNLVTDNKDRSSDSVAESFSEFFTEEIKKIRSTFPRNVEHSSTHTPNDVNLSNFSCFRPIADAF